MSFNSLKLLPITRVFSPTVCRASVHRSAMSNNYWQWRNATSELSNAIHSLENCVKEFDREINRDFGDFQRMSPLNIPGLFEQPDWNQKIDIPVLSTDGKLYKIELDMEGMKPEDIKITLKYNELTITALQDEKREDGSRFVRESAYHYTLPSEVDPFTLRSSFSNGILTIEAQLPEPVEISINIESGENPTRSSNASSNSSNSGQKN